MNKHMKIGVALIAVLLSFVLSPTAQATASSAVDKQVNRSCVERGHHTSVEGVTPIFMEGNIPKHWVSPGSVYSYKQDETVTVTGTINGNVGVDFWNIAHAQVSTSLAHANSVTISQSWSWKNNTRNHQWVQLGVRGYSFHYISYDVVPPCRIVNKRYLAYAILPTNQPWLMHSNY